MKKYNVTLEISVLDFIYDIEAENEDEAVKKAKNKTNYREGEVEVYEIEEIK